MRRFLFCLLIFLLFPFVALTAKDNWQINKSNHFIVHYKNAPEEFIRNLIDKAESYYSNIADDLGFRRYDFWTWDNRANIYIYDDAEDYHSSTGLPEWSMGAAQAQGKVIQTFPYEEGFLETTLPHELGHIIFRESVGFNNPVIPLWLEEGVASYQEKIKYADVNNFLKNSIKNGSFIALEDLSNIDVRLKFGNSVYVFYAEAFSIVNYLISKFGRDNFVNFCRLLRDNKNFEKAVSSAYRVSGLKELNQDWKAYILESNE